MQVATDAIEFKFLLSFDRNLAVGCRLTIAILQCNAMQWRNNDEINLNIAFDIWPTKLQSWIYANASI